eukprot:GILK01003410.1.p1 GENE.GILK01003410.1~~GILK01003410.1.p1  ORF type:complete len:415 (-),score=51.46 GILK01003410.1:98-1342(-)
MLQVDFTSQNGAASGLRRSQRQKDSTILGKRKLSDSEKDPEDSADGLSTLPSFFRSKKNAKIDLTSAELQLLAGLGKSKETETQPSKFPATTSPLDNLLSAHRSASTSQIPNIAKSSKRQLSVRVEHVPDMLPSTSEGSSCCESDHMMRDVDAPPTPNEVKSLHSLLEVSHEEPRYCICRMPESSRPMIGCDICDEWYHLDCVNISEDDVAQIESYSCLKCVPGSARGYAKMKPVVVKKTQKRMEKADKVKRETAMRAKPKRPVSASTKNHVASPLSSDIDILLSAIQELHNDTSNSAKPSAFHRVSAKQETKIKPAALLDLSKYDPKFNEGRIFPPTLPPLPQEDLDLFRALRQALSQRLTYRPNIIQKSSIPKNNFSSVSAPQSCYPSSSASSSSSCAPFSQFPFPAQPFSI